MSASDPALLTRPTIAVGMDAATRTMDMGHLAPKLSQTGPIMTLMKMAVQSLVILEVQTSCFVRPNVSCISFNSGAGANQIIKARKKLIQAQCKARMCGLRILHSLISVALSPSIWSTGTSYREYFDCGQALKGSRLHSSHSCCTRMASCSKGSSEMLTVDSRGPFFSD